MKFNYAPGMPGYGTRGTDGSMGLTGLSTYFSEYDGITQAAGLRSKIANNKILFISDKDLPDGREYVNGDIFIDINAKVFEIDFSETNYFKYTGSYLNTSGYFEALKNSPTYLFQRLSNRFSSEPLLIDVVYTDPGTGDYTTYPTAIYNVATADFAQVKYADKPISGYLPFEVWTVGSANDSDAIALVKESANNTWHFGNYQPAQSRDVSLNLDFSKVNISGNTNFVGNLQLGPYTIQHTSNPKLTIYENGTNILERSGSWNLRGTVQLLDGALYVGGTSFFNGASNLFQGKTKFNNDVSIWSNLYVTGNIKAYANITVNSLNVNNATELAGTLGVNGYTEHRGNVNIVKDGIEALQVPYGHVYIGSWFDVSIYSNLYVYGSGNNNLNGHTYINTLTVANYTELQQSLSVDGSTDLQDTYINGDLIFPAMSADKILETIASGVVVAADKQTAYNKNFATIAETFAGISTNTVICPSTLAALTATEARKGLAELATIAEIVAEVDTTRIVTTVGLYAGINHAFSTAYMMKTFTCSNVGWSLSSMYGSFKQISNMVFVEGRFVLNASGSDSNFRIYDHLCPGSPYVIALSCKCYIPSNGLHFICPCETVNSGTFSMDVFNINGTNFPVGVNMEFKFSGFYLNV